MPTCRECPQEAFEGHDNCYYHLKHAQGLIRPSFEDLELLRKRESRLDDRLRWAIEQVDGGGSESPR